MQDVAFPSLTEKQENFKHFYHLKKKKRNGLPFFLHNPNCLIKQQNCGDLEKS